MPSGFIYPNPVDDILYVDLSQLLTTLNKIATFYDLRLYDGKGNLLRKTTAKGGIVEFDISNLPDGMYFLHIYDGVSITPEVHKVIIKH